METERRHENEKNDLRVLLSMKGPEFFQKHGANILLGLLLVAAIIYFFVQRQKARAMETYAVNASTAIAFNAAMQLRGSIADGDVSPGAAEDRQKLATAALSAAEAVLSSDSDASQKASAQLAKAEVLWALATVPSQAITTTQPVSGFSPRTADAYLQDSKAAYYDLLQKYPDQKEIAANALLSMAAICETEKKFHDAHDWYQKVLRDDTLRSIYHDIARSRAAMLDDLQRPATLAAPSSSPSLLTPITAPSAAAQPSDPTTTPTTQP